MTRFVPVTVLVLLAASRVAGAQSTGMLPSGARVVFEHREIFDEATGTFIEPDSGSTELQHYFNLAHCNCAKADTSPAAPNTVGWFRYRIRLTADSGLSDIPGEFYAGTTCETRENREGTARTCERLPNTMTDIDATLFPSGSVELFNLYSVAISNQPNATNKDCPRIDNINNSIYLLVDTRGGTDFNFAAWQPAGKLAGETGTGSGIDTKPPPLPTGIRADGGDGRILLSWTAPTSNQTDIAYYQALCANLDDSPARSQSDDAQYVTTASLCDAGGDPALERTDVVASDIEQAVDEPEADFAALAEKYICGQTSAGTATSLNITGLSNGTPYKVIFLSVDLHGNYTGTYLTSTVTPVVSTDFWEDIHKDDNDIEGGLCLLAETYGDDSGLTRALRAFRDDTLSNSGAGRWLADAYYATLARLGAYVHGTVVLRIVVAILLAPLVALALLWHCFTLPGLLGCILAVWLWRRRRAGLVREARQLAPRRRVTLAGALMLALGAGTASAGGHQPYWENSNIKEDNDSLGDEPGLVTWNAGIRIGPYLPDIDKGLMTNPGAFARNFHGSRPMPMLDVDRILWTGFGQVGVGVSIGYMQWFEHTFLEGDPDADPPVPRRRSRADTNAFRLVPMALTAVYRFTRLDDDYGIPVVPYVRAGLSYYLWWISVNGSIASTCKDPDAEMCERTKALGASLGLQGSIGLAIRAERIDASTAMSMQQSGIQHAGIYAELSLAKVDGFGADGKLSVGDATWFAGVNFEF